MIIVYIWGEGIDGMAVTICYMKVLELMVVGTRFELGYRHAANADELNSYLETRCLMKHYN